MERKRGRLVEKRIFWGVLAAFLVFVLVGLIGPGISGLTVGKAIQTIGFKKAGSELFFEIRNIDGVKDATITFSQDIKSSEINFKENSDIPFEAAAYNKFTISSVDAEKIGEMRITLKLKKVKLNQVGINQVDVRLYVEGEELVTQQTKTEDGYIFYQAKSSRLGDFVIGRVKAKERVVDEIVEEIIEEIEEPTEVVEEIELEAEVEEIPPTLEQPEQLPIEEREKKSLLVGRIKEGVSFFGVWLVPVIALLVVLGIVVYLLATRKPSRRK